jgi:hypothetical protein
VLKTSNLGTLIDKKHKKRSVSTSDMTILHLAFHELSVIFSQISEKYFRAENKFRRRHMFRKMSKECVNIRECEDQKCLHVFIRLFRFYIKSFSGIWLSCVKTRDY